MPGIEASLVQRVVAKALEVISVLRYLLEERLRLWEGSVSRSVLLISPDCLCLATTTYALAAAACEADILWCCDRATSAYLGRVDREALHAMTR